MGSRKKEVVKRERLPRETGGSFASDTQARVQSTCSRAGLRSEGPGQPGGTANSNLVKFDEEKCKALPLSREIMAATRSGSAVGQSCCRCSLGLVDVELSMGQQRAWQQ